MLLNISGKAINCMTYISENEPNLNGHNSFDTLRSEKEM